MTPKTDTLHSDIGAIQRILDGLDDDDVIVRAQFEHRLRVARAQLAQAVHRPEPKRMPITFRGQPVDGTRAIDASFATNAMKLFMEAAQTVSASYLGVDLKDSGRIPSMGERALQIVDTAVGSFGFVLELPAPAEPEPTQTYLDLPVADSEDEVERSLAALIDLLSAAASDDDDAVAEQVAELHHRAVKKAADFTKFLLDNNAQVSIEFSGRRARLTSEESVSRVFSSLSADHVSEIETTEGGVIIGILPDSRQFEARLEGSDDVTKGKLDRRIQDVEGFAAMWLNKPAMLSLRKVTARSRTRFVLDDAKPRV